MFQDLITQLGHHKERADSKTVSFSNNMSTTTEDLKKELRTRYRIPNEANQGFESW